MSVYTITTLLAVFVVVGGILFVAHLEKLPFKRTVFAVIVSLVCAFIGARLLQILTGAGLSVENFFNSDLQNFSLFGGLAGGGIAGLVTTKLLKLPRVQLANIAVFWTGIGIAVMRVGCFIEGCCYGKPTSVPWGVHPKLFSHAHWHQLQEGTTTILSTQKIHPTQLYELVAALLASLIAYIFYKPMKRKNTLMPVLAWSFSFAFLRLVIHFFREKPDSYLGPDWFYPALYLVICFVSFVRHVAELASFHSASALFQQLIHNKKTRKSMFFHCGT